MTSRTMLSLPLVRCCATRACCSSRSTPRSSVSIARCLTDALRYVGGSPQRVMIDNTHVVVLRGTGREIIPVPEMEAFAERFDSLSWRTRSAMPIVRRAWNVRLLHRKQLSGRPHILQLGGSESAGAPVVRQGQLHLQETYPRGASRVIRGRTPASPTATGVDSRSVSPAPAHGGCGGVRLGELHSLLGSGLLDRAKSGNPRDQGQDRHRTGCAPPRHPCPRCNSAVTRITLAEHRPPRGEAQRSAPRRTSPLTGRSGDRRVCDSAEAKGPSTTGNEAWPSCRSDKPGHESANRQWWRLPCGNCCAC